jgi:phage terminase large subunit-like protein
MLYALLEEQLKSPERVRITKGSTKSNAGNLAQSYIDHIYGVYEGSRLASQELEGNMLDAVEGALWTVEQLDDLHVSVAPLNAPLRVIGVDPSVAENPRDECGIVVVSSTSEYDLFKRRAWVLEDATVHGAPPVWAQRVVDMAHKWGAPVVAEVNQGGALVKNAIQNIDPSIRVHEVHSKQGKKLRAEPITLAYDQKRVMHLGYLAELEDQMTSWVPEEGKSPDRVDALVHALTALLIKPPVGLMGGRISAQAATNRHIPISKGLQNRGRGGPTAPRFRVR